MMGQSVGFAPVLLALLARVFLSCPVLGQSSEQQSDEITLEREQIFINLENITTFSLMIEPDDQVIDLLDDIYEYEGLPGPEKQAVLGGANLNYTTRLSDYNIRAGTILTLNVHDDHRTVNLSVNTLGGHTQPLITELSNSVSSLKESIAKLTDVPRAQQRLLIRGRELKDERKLNHYSIYNGTIINLGRTLDDCHQVATFSVKTLSGASFELEVNLADTVTELKNKIWRKTGVPAGVQRLNANDRLLMGEDHLCDLGLEAGTIVYMFLYSSRITSLDQIARLREPPAAPPVNPYREPIFHEAENVVGQKQSGRNLASLYKDARNWVVRSGARPGLSLDLMDPVAHLAPDPSDERSMQSNQQTLEELSRREASESDRLEAEIFRARIKLSSAIRPYRVAANLTSRSHRRQNPGITLGGGSTDESSKKMVHLGADVNNWAPDNFCDSDLMRLFEVSERVRQILAKAEQTGDGILSIDSQRRINRAILLSYHAALAGYSPLVEHNHSGGDEECGICRDELAAEPAIKLACEHGFHADCILSWVTNLYTRSLYASCPFCRQRFLFPYEALGGAELETPELKVTQDL